MRRRAHKVQDLIGHPGFRCKPKRCAYAVNVRRLRFDGLYLRYKPVRNLQTSVAPARHAAFLMGGSWDKTSQANGFEDSDKEIEYIIVI